MKRLIIVAAIAVIAAPAFAGSDIYPIDGMNYMNYNAATGEMTKVAAETRRVGATIWEASYAYVAWVYGVNPFQGEASSDWGDVGIGSVVGGFEFSQFTNSMDNDGDLWAVILYYEEDNGFNGPRVYTAGIVIENIPGNNHNPNQYWGYRWRVELNDSFILDGSDLDGDSLGDFGYWMFFAGKTPGCLHGPGLWGDLSTGGVDPNNLPPECPGVDMYFDRYKDPLADQNAPQDPNSWNASYANIDPNNVNADYVATSYFNPGAYGQFHMALFAPACPNRGEAGRYCQADIGDADCIISLSDLAQLLGNYGCQSDPNGPDICTLSMGDVDPYDEWFPGDGDVDLGDLAELLGQYGDNCNWPQ